MTPRYNLRTLLIVLALGPIGAWLAWNLLVWTIYGRHGPPGAPVPVDSAFILFAVASPWWMPFASAVFWTSGRRAFGVPFLVFAASLELVAFVFSYEVGMRFLK